MIREIASFGIQNYDVAAQEADRHVLREFEEWRTELTSFESVGAAATGRQNLVTDDGRAAPVRGSEITASSFAVLRVRPQLGRMLLPADEAPGATPVVVLGFDLWHARFGEDPEIVGRTVQLGGRRRTVVGVMPRGFLFPYRDEFWVPLQARPLDYVWGSGPGIVVFGRLADGVSLEQARAEVETLGRRMAAAHPGEYATLRPEVVPFTWTLMGLRGEFRRVYPVELFALLLLAIACGNVATLMLARTSSRLDEIAVRNALGASRGRIVGQLFTEALVLSLLATAAGLALGHVVVGRLSLLTTSMPYWFDLDVKLQTVILACTLAMFSSVFAGVLPALKATNRGLQANLQRAASRASGIRFGAVSTGLIVAEVAVAVGLLTPAAMIAPSALEPPSSLSGIAANEFLTARVALPREAPPTEGAETYGREFRERLVSDEEELARRLRSEPSVRGVALGDRLPGMDHPRVVVQIEGNDPASDPLEGHAVRRAKVVPGFFEGLGSPIRAGRAFDATDLDSEDSGVIVNRRFADQVLRGQSAVGRRLRFRRGRNGEYGPWREIVGIVDDLGMSTADPTHGAGVYEPVSPKEIDPVDVAVHLSVDPGSFAPRLRQIGVSVDATLMVDEVTPMDSLFSVERWAGRWASLLFGLLASIAIVLSAAGLYALVSFTVSKRTREIGIRTALGARTGRIAGVISRRALLQLLAGVVLGGGLAWMLREHTLGVTPARMQDWPLVLLGVSVVMVAMGMIACAPPMLRALRIQPSEALRDGG